MTKILTDPYVISVGFIHSKHLSIGGVWPDLDALEHHFSPQSEHGVGLTVLLKEESPCPIFAGYGLPDYMELMGGKANFYRMQAGYPPAYYGVEPWLYVPAIVARELEMDVKSMVGTRESRKVRFWRTEENVPKGPGGTIPIYGPTFYARREALLRDLAHYKEIFLKNKRP